MNFYGEDLKQGDGQKTPVNENEHSSSGGGTSNSIPTNKNGNALKMARQKTVDPSKMVGGIA